VLFPAPSQHQKNRGGGRSLALDDRLADVAHVFLARRQLRAGAALLARDLLAQVSDQTNRTDQFVKLLAKVLLFFV
jgi:hypothetical protein